MARARQRGYVVRKSYGPVQALAGVDIEIRRGEVFGLLGPNGAGKTTLVEILEGHRKRDAGEATVLGLDPDSGERELRERIGIVLQEEGVDGVLTVREAVEIYSASYPRPRDARECIELVGLEEKAERARGNAVGRPAPAARPCTRHRRRPGADLPRRAHHRLRPLRTPHRHGR